MNCRNPLVPIVSAIALICAATPALAGPPLVCWPVETGGAPSLPWVEHTEAYKGADLAADTLALLDPSTPVLARMETLRRAAIYASADDAAGKALLSSLVERTKRDPKVALAWFDAGYFIEASRQAKGRNTTGFWAFFLDATGMRVNEAESLGVASGYDAIVKAIALSGGDPAMEYAAALVSWYPRRPEHAEHLKRAAAGAEEGSLLAKNLLRNFGDHGTTLADLRAGATGRY